MHEGREGDCGSAVLRIINGGDVSGGGGGSYEYGVVRWCVSVGVLVVTHCLCVLGMRRSLKRSGVMGV